MPPLQENAAVARLLRDARSSVRWSHIAGLGLANFQAVREPVFLPIAPLTFLYGPNSAGKSCIGDALGLLHAFGTRAPGLPWVSMLERWGNWDRHLANQDGSDAEKKVALWAIVTAGEHSFGRAYDMLGGSHGAAYYALSDDIGPWAISIEFDWDPRGPQASRSPRWCHTKLWLGDESTAPALVFERFENGETELRLQTRHLHYPTIERGFQMADQGELAKSLENAGAGELRAYPGGYVEHPGDTDIPENFDDVQEFRATQYLMSLFRLATQALGELADVVVTPPTRPVPDRKSTTFAVLPPFPAAPISRVGAGIGVNASGPWYEIAEDVARGPDARRGRDCTPFPSLFEYLNHVLGNESLLGLGFRLSADVVPFGPRPPDVSSDAGPGYLVHLHLMDEQGHLVEFQDVGTGVSQLIPVLTALWAFRPAVIHQPELHLHPALQSVLGDVLVARPDRPPKILESHSEHLLLRILRRIRETTSLGVKAPYPVVPRDVAVLYFDPLDNGDTRILSLRIDEAGNFLDRWPRGFFVDRDEDLGLV